MTKYEVTTSLAQIKAPPSLTRRHPRTSGERERGSHHLRQPSCTHVVAGSAHQIVGGRGTRFQPRSPTTFHHVVAGSAPTRSPGDGERGSNHVPPTSLPG